MSYADRLTYTELWKRQSPGTLPGRAAVPGALASVAIASPGEPKSLAALDLGAGAVAPELAYVTASYRLNGCERRLSRTHGIDSTRMRERTL